LENNNKTEGAIPVIDIEKGLNNLIKKKLTDFKSNIRYVQLEFSENCLIGNTIENVYVEDGKIFIRDNSAPYLKVFDALTGKYLYNIGKRGQGPGELPHLQYIDMNVKEKCVILGWGGKALKFDFAGNYLYNIGIPVLPDSLSTDLLWNNVVMLDRTLYSVGAYTVSSHQINALYIFDAQLNIINTLKSYDQYIQHHTIPTHSPQQQMGFLYRYMDYIYFSRGLCDTVYVYNSSKDEFEPHYSFNFGKHRQPRDYGGPGTTPNPDEIRLQRLSENDRFVFMDFYTKRASTEPFYDYFYRSNNELVEFSSHALYAIYDKQNRIFNFLQHPIKDIRGLVNDIDYGIPFWPKYVSSNGEMVDYHQSYRFIEYAEKLPNPDDSFKTILENIDGEDNPIIIIAY
jgi:hypothetical protein